MNKSEFVSEIKPILKKLDYKKNNTYWYKYHEDYIECICVCGSQWDMNDYFIEVGYSTFENGKYPTLLNWYCRYMLEGQSGQYNISPIEFFNGTQSFFDSISSKKDIDCFIKNSTAIKVGNQFIITTMNN